MRGWYPFLHFKQSANWESSAARWTFQLISTRPLRAMSWMLLKAKRAGQKELERSREVSAGHQCLSLERRCSGETQHASREPFIFDLIRVVSFGGEFLGNCHQIWTGIARFAKATFAIHSERDADAGFALSGYYPFPCSGSWRAAKASSGPFRPDAHCASPIRGNDLAHVGYSVQKIRCGSNFVRKVVRSW